MKRRCGRQVLKASNDGQKLKKGLPGKFIQNKHSYQRWVPRLVLYINFPLNRNFFKVWAVTWFTGVSHLC